MVINPIVGVYIPIIRIPIKGGMTIPNIATFDHGTYTQYRLVTKVLLSTAQLATLTETDWFFSPGVFFEKIISLQHPQLPSCRPSSLGFCIVLAWLDFKSSTSKIVRNSGNMSFVMSNGWCLLFFFQKFLLRVGITLHRWNGWSNALDQIILQEVGFFQMKFWFAWGRVDMSCFSHRYFLL